jgi:hypothetical protein
MSDSDQRVIDKNRISKKYPYVRSPARVAYISDSPSFDPAIDGYYENGQLVPVPDGLWLNGANLEDDLSQDFCWYQQEVVEVGDMLFGLKWSEIEPGPGGQPAGFQGNLGQLVYADGDGNVYAAQSVVLDEAAGLLSIEADIIPFSDLSFDLGSEQRRFANVYTGDLHLRNDRGHWQIVEEADCLTITNRLDGRRYKFVLEPLDEGAIP